MKFEKPKCTAVRFSEGLLFTKFEKPNSTAVTFSERLPCTKFEDLNVRQLDFQAVRFKRHIFSTNIVIYKTCFPDGNVLKISIY